MKTKSEYEAGLYRQIKLNSDIAIAMYIVVGIGVVVDIFLRIEGAKNHFDVASREIGFISPLLFCCVFLYHFFWPADIEKEKKTIEKEIDVLKQEREYFDPIAFGEAQNQNPEKIYQKKIEEIQQKIWKLEWKRKQIGG